MTNHPETSKQMIAKPSHNRKLGLIGVALTKQRRNRHATKALVEIRDEIEKVLIESHYFQDAPFSWVTIAVRYGLKNDDQPSYQAVNKKSGDLPLAIEIDTHEMTSASQEELKVVFKRAILRALIHAGRRFEHQTESLEKMLDYLPHI